MTAPPLPDDATFLTYERVLLLHAQSLRAFGGAGGVRDEGLIRSAIGRVELQITFEKTASLYDLAATYGVGLAKNHGFVDGNKRVGLLAIFAFLYANGFFFDPDEAEAVVMMTGAADSDSPVDERVIAEWIGRCTTPLNRA